MKKIFMIFGVLIVFLAGCGSTSSGDTFTYSIKKPIESLDIAKGSYKQTFELYADIYATLFEVNGQGELVDGLATNMEISDDGLVYTITLRDDAVWIDSKGQEQAKVTAQDFVFAWQRMVDPSVGALYAFIFEPIQNATQITNGKKPKEELGVEAVDDYTLKITLETPTPYFQSLLAFPSFGAQSIKAAEEFGQDYATSESTNWYNGPYYVQTYKPDAETHIKKNDLYYDKDAIEVEDITYKVVEDASSRYNGFKSGELDYVELENPTDIEDAKSQDTLTTDLTGYSYFEILNSQEDRVTSNDNLRKALAYGFDREGIEDTVYGGTNNVIEYIIPAGITEVAYDGVEYRDYTEDSLISYDKAKADEYFDKYMEDMGYTDRSEIKIKYLCEDSPVLQKVGEVIQAHYLQEFGIKIEITALPFEQYVSARANGDFDMITQSWGPDYADPSTYMALWQTVNIGALNYAQYSNAQYDELYKEAAAEVDVDKRFKEFGELEKMLVQEDILIPFYQQNNNKVITKGYTVPSHLFMIISHKYITKDIKE